MMAMAPPVLSIGAPQPWPPPPTQTPSTSSSSSSSANNKSFRDCTAGICTTNCLQWCGSTSSNSLFLPPPPPFLTDSDDDGNRISPLMAALIAVLAAAFLLLFYYTVVSRLCRRRSRRPNRHRNLRAEILDLDSEANGLGSRVDSMVQDPARPAAGLDESFIRQITVFKYRRSDGLIDGTDCAVCLNEFNEEESLRLMPNCEHAFHIPCIDTWLKTHSNCPLCRSTMNPTPPARVAPTPVVPGPGTNTNAGGDQRSGSGNGVSVAAMQVQRGGDAVLVIREMDNEVMIVCHESEENGNGNGDGIEGREGRENGESMRNKGEH